MTSQNGALAPVDQGGLPEESALNWAVKLQDNLVSYATGGGFEGDEEGYQALRRFFVQRLDTRELLPGFVHRCRDLAQFWHWIKHADPTYAGRREILWSEFAPLLDHLEEAAPGERAISEALAAFNADAVRTTWQKALDRRVADPEGAITAARALLESACKHVIEEAGGEYAADSDLPQLWRQAALELNLAPEQHQEAVFKAILGNAQSIVNNLGAVRNRLGDAHGVGRRQVRPRPRHAELVVNLAGSMAAFLVASWLERTEASSSQAL